MDPSHGSSGTCRQPVNKLCTEALPAISAGPTRIEHNTPCRCPLGPPDRKPRTAPPGPHVITRVPALSSSSSHTDHTPKLRSVQIAERNGSLGKKGEKTELNNFEEEAWRGKEASSAAAEDGGGVPLLRGAVLRAHRHHRGAGALRGAHVRAHPRPHVPQPRRPRGPRQVRHRQGPQVRRCAIPPPPPFLRVPWLPVPDLVLF